MPRLDYIITARDETKKALASAHRGLKAFEKQHKETIQNLKTVALPAAGFFGAVVLGARKAVQESNKMENALTGLVSVAEAFTGESEKAQEAAYALASDGLMTVAESAQGLKNLLARGFGLDEATQLMNSFKDSAAFGRQAQLGLGEAIVGATEGLKNQMSNMVDNAGVTKNLSNIHKDYAASIGLTIGQLDEDMKREAELKGILQETAAQRGDAAKLTELFSGRQAQLSASTDKLAAALGDKVKPALAGVLAGVNGVVNSVLTFTQEHEQATKVVLGIVAALAGGAGLVAAFGAVAALLPVITAGVGLLGTAFTIATGPVGLIVLGVAAAIAIFMKFRTQLGDLVEFIVKTVSGKLADMAEGLAHLVLKAQGLPGIGKKATELGGKLLETAESARTFGEEFKLGGDAAEEAIKEVADTTEKATAQVKDDLDEAGGAMREFADLVKDEQARINTAMVASTELQKQESDQRRAAALAEAEYRGRLVQQQIDGQKSANGKMLTAQGDWQNAMEGSFGDINARHGKMWDDVEDRADTAYGGLQGSFGDGKASVWVAIMAEIIKLSEAFVTLFEGIENLGGNPGLGSDAFNFNTAAGPGKTGGGGGGGMVADHGPFSSLGKTGSSTTLVQNFNGPTLVDRAQGLETIQSLRDLEGEFDRGLTFTGAS